MLTRPGERLSNYRLVEKIGEGGMGVVWRAVDETLDREVALKILPRTFAEQPERLARFRREAKVLAALNHTNIAAIFGLEETEGLHYLVLELAPGVTLAERLKGGPLPTRDALEICRQIAEAFVAAHERGIVHRDLKPANIKIAADGKVKVLDFGLAKALETDGAPDISHSPTVTHHMTQAGLILGTAGYMSPEQARGKPVDRRTDIWAFGCLLYECLTGQQAFPGETITDSLAAILHKEPDWNKLPSGLPPEVLRLFVRCLQKDPERRLHDIADVRIEIEEALALRDSVPSGYRALASLTASRDPVVGRWRVPAFAAALFVVGLALGAGLFSWVGGRGRADRPARVARFSIAPGLDSSFPIVSPDGSMLAYVVREESARGPTSHLYTRRLDQFLSSPVAGSEDVVAHTFSPDGRWLAFVAPFTPGAAGYKLAKVPSNGSAPPLELADWPAEMGPGLVWLPDGYIVGIREKPQAVLRFPDHGGSPVDPVEIDSGEFKGSYIVVSALPDGRNILAAAGAYGSKGFHWSVAAIDTRTGRSSIVIEDGTIAAWTSTGHILFTRKDTLLAVPFDPRELKTTGGPITLLGGLLTVNALVGGWFDVSDNGALVYQPGGVQGTNRRLAFVDSDARVTPWVSDRRAFTDEFSLSPDGRRVAVTLTASNGLDEIRVSDLESPLLRKLVEDPGLDCRSPAWTPDAERVVYFCIGEGDIGTVFVRRFDGTDAPEALFTNDAPGVLLYPTSVSADGRWIAVQRVAEDERILLLPFSAVAGSHDAHPMAAADGNDSDAKFSPDGRWIAYVSDRTGREEVYLRSVDARGSTGPATQVSTIGGSRPLWSRAAGNRFELLYETEAGRIVGVAVEGSDRIRIGSPRTWVDLTRLRADGMGAEALSDGRLLVVQRGDEEDGGSIRVVLNWVAELESRISPPE